MVNGRLISILSILTLGALLAFLQYSLWAGKHNVIDLLRLQRQVNIIEAENIELSGRNDALHEDVIDIKNRSGAIESQARYHLGLIKRGETFYQIVRSIRN